MQNLAQFRTTSKFGGEYLWNGWRYSKSDSHSVYGDSSCVRRSKYGKVWSSDLRDLDVKSYPLKAPFSEKPYFGHYRVLCPQIFTRTRGWPSLTSALPTWDGGPLTTFFKGESKIALKCSILDEVSLEPKGVASWDFATWRAATWGW